MRNSCGVLAQGFDRCTHRGDGIVGGLAGGDRCVGGAEHRGVGGVCRPRLRLGRRIDGCIGRRLGSRAQGSTGSEVAFHVDGAERVDHRVPHGSELGAAFGVVDRIEVVANGDEQQGADSDQQWDGCCQQLRRQ